MPAKPAMPARLHVLLARDACNAVVIRRGPSRHTAVIGWDRDSDQFQPGQWLHGRIYERRCDLSPDGTHLIYFAMNGRFNTGPLHGSWTAISRAPYLKALCLYAKGDCWHGGGLFLSATDYWLNDDGRHELRQEDPRLHRVRSWPHEPHGGECPGVYHLRLQRDGWRMLSATPDGSGGWVRRFDKPVNAQWVLRKHTHATLNRPLGRGAYYDTHELLDPATGRSFRYDSWEWADMDGDRLVWADSGCLYAGRVGPDGLGTRTQLFDFRPLRFEAIAAPY